MGESINTVSSVFDTSAIAVRTAGGGRDSRGFLTHQGHDSGSVQAFDELFSMRGDQKLNLTLIRLSLEIIKYFTLQIHVQVGIRLIEQYRGRFVSVEESEQSKCLVKAAPSSDDVVRAFVLFVFADDLRIDAALFILLD